MEEGKGGKEGGREGWRERGAQQAVGLKGLKVTVIGAGFLHSVGGRNGSEGGGWTTRLLCNDFFPVTHPLQKGRGAQDINTPHILGKAETYKTLQGPSVIRSSEEPQGRKPTKLQRTQRPTERPERVTVSGVDCSGMQLLLPQ